MPFHAEFTPRTPNGAAPLPPASQTGCPSGTTDPADGHAPRPTESLATTLLIDIAAPSRATRLAAVLHPGACAEVLRRAYDGVRDDGHPVAGLVRSVVAARLHVAWLAASHPVAAATIARAAAGRVPLPIPVEVLSRATAWSPLVRAAIGRELRHNPDPLAALLGTRWCRAVDGEALDEDDEPP